MPEASAADLDWAGALEALLSTPELGDKSWIYRQYDSTVRANTVVGPGGDAAVLRLQGTPSALALSSDVNPVYCYLDPRTGGRQAVAEAARNLACVGARPLALTDCLNFGSPEIPEVAWQLRECIEGMAEACRALEVPVVSGNVSLYNDTEGRSIHPTPTVAMVGLIEELEARSHPELGATLLEAGHRLLLLGSGHDAFGGSAYLRLLFDVEQGHPPPVDLAAEAALGRALRELHRRGALATCHDLSDGGLAVALAEASFGRGIGARVHLEGPPLALFAENQGRALVAVTAERVNEVLAVAEREGVDASEIGEVGGEHLEFDTAGERWRVEVARLHRAWQRALPRALGL